MTELRMPAELLDGDLRAPVGKQEVNHLPTRLTRLLGWLSIACSQQTRNCMVSFTVLQRLTDINTIKAPLYCCDLRHFTKKS